MSRIFICIVQVSSLATACVDQPLLTFWSHPDKTWMFGLRVAAIKTNIVLQLYCLR